MLHYRTEVSDRDCPRCGYAGLEYDPRWSIRTCKGCGRVFLAAGEPEDWPVVGHLKTR